MVNHCNEYCVKFELTDKSFSLYKGNVSKRNKRMW